jgi:hypothetical protein
MNCGDFKACLTPGTIAESAHKLALLFAGIAVSLASVIRGLAAPVDPAVETVPTLTQVWSTNRLVLADVCHALLFYGLGPTDLPGYSSGKELLKTLLDERRAIETFGKTPLIRTRSGVRYLLSEDQVFHSAVGESHRDQCLATFAALDLPLDIPLHLVTPGTYSISNLLSDSVANFSFDQHEPAWTAIAYAKYLPPGKDWKNRFGETTSFSKMTDYLLNVKLNSQSCAGTHIFQALASIERAHRKYAILDQQTDERLAAYLQTTLREITERQLADGSWGGNWCQAASSGGQSDSVRQRILVTGHLLETLNGLDPSRRLPSETYMRAALWLRHSLNSDEVNGMSICPFTHAVRGASAVLGPSSANTSKGAQVFHRVN